MLTQQVEPGLRGLVVVPGQAGLLDHLLLGAIADVPGLADAMRGRPLARQVGAAAVDVVVHAHHGDQVLVGAAHAVDVAVVTGAEFQIEARVVVGARLRVLRHRGVDVRHRRCQGRVRVARLGGQRRQVGRKGVRRCGWRGNVGRHFADHAQIGNLGIAQVAELRFQVGLGQRQTAGRLVGVGHAAHAALAAHANLVIHALVGRQVVAGQLHLLAPPQHINVGLRGAQSDVLGRRQHAIRRRLQRRRLARHLLSGKEAVEQHLRDRDAALLPVQAKVPLPAGSAERRGVVALLAADAGVQVHPRQVSGLRAPHVLLDGAPVILRDQHVRVVRDGFVNGVGKVARQYRASRQRQHTRQSNRVFRVHVRPYP